MFFVEIDTIKRKFLKKGFTFIELIIVIAIFSLILFIALPKWESALRIRERAEINTFKRDLIYCRNKSITEGKMYIVRLDTKENCYSLYKEEMKKELIKRVYFESGLLLYRQNFHDNQIIFNPTGSPSQGGTIGLKNRREEIFEITIQPVTGKINIERKER